jgi:hypothetical protein
MLAVLSLMLVAALPVMAEEGDPLANSVMLPGTVAWAMVGLAIVLVVLFRLWTRRGPN